MKNRVCAFVGATTTQLHEHFLHVQLYFKLFVSGASSSKDWAALNTSGDPLLTVLSTPMAWDIDIFIGIKATACHTDKLRVEFQRNEYMNV